jgi:hypothetical protein
MMQDNLTHFLNCVERAPVKHPVAVSTHNSQLAQPDAVLLRQLPQGNAVMALSKPLSQGTVHQGEVELAGLAEEFALSG